MYVCMYIHTHTHIHTHPVKEDLLYSDLFKGNVIHIQLVNDEVIKH